MNKYPTSLELLNKERKHLERLIDGIDTDLQDVKADRKPLQAEKRRYKATLRPILKEIMNQEGLTQ